ncbi:MAG: RNase adapter RapZ [Deltaproteobacteria bacterium]|nr:RNase adapter RapZ [Deltaproteobacteria bacterium]MBW1958142.1 RNase adapter RapZ [Deltaproteobacteria bacterium]MBW2012959.1 RNase adapter RapZ [Deltaproteobacteria bacterium]MBW2088889.1 RNase adapter RapZ [Deltaproteobacteria bacterium]MBW2320362.1 RNase adapter RapZ [Deltaproteobacteria bacterium]
MKKLKIIIITGLSGSGKSTAISAFEDAGFYCVDNMPVALLPKFLELPIESDSEIAGLAFVMDLREKSFLSRYPFVFDSLKEKGYRFKILFLEAEEETLLKRYSQTRRHHPLSQDKSLLEGIRIEQDQLKDLKRTADKIIDTSRYNVHKLKSVINYIAQQSKIFAPMKINILSFGFKYGTPHDASLIMDVRFLANPYFVPELKALNGKSPDIKNYVLNNNEATRFLKKYLGLLDYLIPLYEKEGKSYLTIAVGCTGGRHRSVSIAEAIFEHIKKPGRQIIITHRDISL